MNWMKDPKNTSILLNYVHVHETLQLRDIYNL